MRAMGFAEHLVKLAIGLVEKAESKVHINSRFIESIKLERGVKQGCPLSALLFTISQPLMLMIKEKLSIGEFEGIRLDNRDQLTHQLFVDDTGLFFTTQGEQLSMCY